MSSYHGTMLIWKGIVSTADSMCAETNEVLIQYKGISVLTGQSGQEDAEDKGTFGG